MCDTSNITVGTIVMVKVGRNEIEVVVTEITANGWKVKKVGRTGGILLSKVFSDLKLIIEITLSIICSNSHFECMGKNGWSFLIKVILPPWNGSKNSP